MSLKIIKVIKGISPDKELLVLETKSKEKIDLKDFVVSILSFDKNPEFDNIFENSYRFPSCLVNKNDTIYLYTGEGQNSSNVSGSSVDGDLHHFRFYRNSKISLIKNSGDKVILSKFEIVNTKTAL